MELVGNGVRPRPGGLLLLRTCMVHLVSSAPNPLGTEKLALRGTLPSEHGGLKGGSRSGWGVMSEGQGQVELAFCVLCGVLRVGVVPAMDVASPCSLVACPCVLGLGCRRCRMHDVRCW